MSTQKLKREPEVPRAEVEGWRILSPESMPVEGEIAIFKSTAHGLVTGRVVYSDSMFARVPKGVTGKALETDATFFRDVTHWLRLPDARPVVFAERVPREQENWKPDASTPRVLCPVCGGSGHSRDGAGRVLGDCTRCSGTGAVNELRRETIPAPLPAWTDKRDDGDIL